MYGKLSSGWNSFLLPHVIYLAIMLPYRVAFEVDITHNQVAFDFYLEAVFYLDIIITLLTPFHDSNGYIVYNKKKIFLKYLKGWLIPELIACIPYSYFYQNTEGTKNHN